MLLTLSGLFYLLSLLPGALCLHNGTVRSCAGESRPPAPAPAPAPAHPPLSVRCGRLALHLPLRLLRDGVLRLCLGETHTEYSAVQYSTVLCTRVTVHDVSCSNPSSPRVGAPRRWTAQVATLVTGRSVTPSVPSARLWTVSSAE